MSRLHTKFNFFVFNIKEKSFMSNKQKHLAPPPSLIGLMSVGEGSRDEGISLCVKFKTSRMLSSAIFWWGWWCVLLLLLLPLVLAVVLVVVLVTGGKQSQLLV